MDSSFQNTDPYGWIVEKKISQGQRSDDDIVPTQLVRCIEGRSESLIDNDHCRIYLSYQSLDMFVYSLMLFTRPRPDCELELRGEEVNTSGTKVDA